MNDLAFSITVSSIICCACLDMFLRYKSGWTKQEVDDIRMDNMKGGLLVIFVVGLVIYLTP
ncbi:MAG: hypothetical protein GY861_14550 [bacterium]|nr:hypothetical protein [bacterium]